MLAKRIIPCLDIKDGRVVKGVNFVNLRDAGDAVADSGISLHGGGCDRGRGCVLWQFPGAHGGWRHGRGCGALCGGGGGVEMRGVRGGGANPAGGTGAATAVRERKLVGKIKIVAMDRGNEILSLIDKGVIDATIAQQTALMPFYAVQILYNYQNVNIPVAMDNAKAGISGVPAGVDTGVIVVDKTNCKLFLRN